MLPAGVRHWTIGLFFLLIAGLSAAQASALTVVNGDYKLPAKIDTTVAADLKTELWARVWRPKSSGRYPLIVFLHGNHNTCGHFDAGLGIRVDDNFDYSTTGTCPPGYVVTPNHLGYNYMAANLAAAGYVVVSINANLGVNAADGVSGDFGLNLRRGRLVLRHLQELSAWNGGKTTPASLGFSLLNSIDFAQVGLMGHSRGGEGMRAAIAQYRDAGSLWPGRIGPVRFRALFEIGPVDGQTDRILNATGMAWNVLLPGCDGDVADLEGIKPFDRMIRIGSEAVAFEKSSIQVFGANHNFYNSQWLQSDTKSCRGQTPLFPQTGGSAAQRQTAYVTLVNFFRAHVGTAKQPALAQIFDPSFALPATLTNVTTYARGLTPSPRSDLNFKVDDFGQTTGLSSNGVANQSSGLSQYVHGIAGFSHDASQRAAAVNWSSTGGFLQVNAANAGVPVDVSAFSTLEFRVALRCFDNLCNTAPNPAGDVNFSVSLAASDGSFSGAKSLNSFAAVGRPVGASFDNVILQTVRIPLSAFAGAKLAAFRGVRFTFDKTAASSIYLANVRLDKAPAGTGGLAPAQSRGSTGAIVAQPMTADANTAALRRVRSVAGLAEIELRSNRAFPVSDALPELRIGGQLLRLSRFAPGDTHVMIFTFNGVEFAEVKNGDSMVLHVGGAKPWAFGTLRKP